MSQQNTSGWKKWLRYAGIAAAVGLLVVISLYFYVTSAGFLKNTVLPKVSETLGAKVTVTDATIQPFSHVALQGLSVVTTGTEPVLKADTVRLRYKLSSFFGDTPTVDEITLDAPAFQLIQNADGTSNLDPILAALKKMETKPEAPKPADTSKPVRISLKNFSINNATFHITKFNKDGSKEVTDVTGVSLKLDQLGNDQSGALTLAAVLNQAKTLKGATAPTTTLHADLKGKFNLAMDAALRPKSVQGETVLNVSQASGDLAELNGLNTTLRTDMSPTEIKSMELAFGRNGNSFGKVTVSGPFSAEKKEGQLNIVISGIDRNALNLFALPLGYDLNKTALNGTQRLVLSQSGDKVELGGNLKISDFSVTANKMTTPVLNIGLDYEMEMNAKQKTALVKSLSLAGTQGIAPLIKASLTSPLTLNLGSAAMEAGEADLTASLTKFKLKDWQAVLGTNAPEGMVDASLKLQASKGGAVTALTVDSTISGLTLPMGTNHTKAANVTAGVVATVKDMTTVDVSSVRLVVAERGNEAVSAGIKGTMNLKTGDAKFDSTVSVTLTHLADWMNQKGVAFKSGTVGATTTFTQTGGTNAVRSIQSAISLNNLTGEANGLKWDAASSQFSADIGLQGTSVSVKKLSGVFTQAGKPGGSFDMNAAVDTASMNGNASMKFSELNERALRPFLAAALGEKQLESILANGSVDAKFQGNADASIKADLKISNLVAKDPKQKNPYPPLAAELAMDGSLKKQVLDLSKLTLKLTPTKRAANEISLTGKLDMSRTNAMQGGFVLNSDALDLTSYYDLFSSDTAAIETQQPELKPAAKQPSTEPLPVLTPFEKTTFSATIGKLYLRELAIEGFQAKVAIDKGHVVVNPLQLSINGAPVSSTVDLDMGVPGFRYDVVLKATKIPIAPLANSFSPEYKGKASGDLFADIKIKGAGVTGGSLRSNANGGISLNFTNANIQAVGPNMKAIMYPIAIVLGMPEIMGTPLDHIGADVALGSGNITLSHLMIHSPLFIGTSQGVIPIKNELMDSPLKLPLTVSLPQNLAKKFSVTGKTPQDPYAALPNFVSVEGTLGKVETKVDKLVIAGLTLKAAGGLPVNLGGRTTDTLKGLGGFLTGEKPSTNTTTTTTNKPSNTQTNKTINANDVLNLFKK